MSTWWEITLLSVASVILFLVAVVSLKLVILFFKSKFWKFCSDKATPKENHLTIKFKRESIFYQRKMLILLFVLSLYGTLGLFTWVFKENVNIILFGFQILSFILLPLNLVLKVFINLFSRKTVEDYSSELVPVYDQKTFEKFFSQLKNIDSIIKEYLEESGFYKNQLKKKDYLEKSIKSYQDFIEIQEYKITEIKNNHPKHYKWFYFFLL